MYLFVHHETCRQLSFCLSGRMLHSGEISCLSGHMLHSGEVSCLRRCCPLVVLKVRTIWRFKVLCELGVCDPMLDHFG